MTIKFYIMLILFSIYFVCSASANDFNDLNSKKILKLIDNYLGEIVTIQSDFVQTDKVGKVRNGRIFINKPNYFRIEYTTPDKELIVFNTDLIMYHDVILEETNYLAKDNLMLEILTQKDFKISKQAKIHSLEVTSELILVSFSLNSHDQSKLTELQFYRNPLKLKSIRIYQNDDFVNINLINPTFNHLLSEHLFNFNNKVIN